jgi:hypothetical protein
VDLTRGTIHLHQSADRKSRAVKRIKTKTTRRVPIEPHLRPLLEALVREAGGAGRVVRKMPPAEDMAEYLRKCLGYAGCTRAELFADDATRRPVSFHDLRATGITWLAIRGDEPLRIQERAGHTSFTTTQGYIRLAETLGDLGEVFPALPAALLGGSAQPAPAGSVTDSVTEMVKGPEPSLVPSPSLRPQRDLNPSTGPLPPPNALKRQGPFESGERFASLEGGSVTGFVTAVTPRGDVAAIAWGDRAIVAEIETELAVLDLTSPGGDA